MLKKAFINAGYTEHHTTYEESLIDETTNEIKCRWIKKSILGASSFHNSRDVRQP